MKKIFTIILLLFVISNVFARQRHITNHNYITDIDTVFLGDTLTSDTLYSNWLVSGADGLPYGIVPDRVYSVMTIQDSANSGGFTPSNTCTLRVSAMFIDGADSVWENISEYYSSSGGYGTKYTYFESLPFSRLRWIWVANNGIVRIGYSLIKED